MNKQKINTLILNLPHSTRIVRRYMCSSLGSNYYFPPIELISLAAMVRSKPKQQVSFLDCIGEGINVNQVIEHVGINGIEVVISICGFETIEEDLVAISRIKEARPEAITILFGYYPTLFAEEILKHSKLDFIILGEPDLIVSDLYDYFLQVKDLASISGIAYKKDQNIVIQPSKSRIPDPNMLPMPAFDLLNSKLYYEFLMPRPFGLIQTARGCPYTCNYCVRSFGQKLTMLKPENILEQIEFLINKHSIKSLRFIDDTFTAVPKRVIDLCRLMVEKKLNIQWTCLSRVDTINEEMIYWMKQAGCKRIYFGVESGSPRILEILHKSVDLVEAKKNVLLCKKFGIETAAFFMFGCPEETPADFDLSLSFAKQCDLDFVSVGELTPYPGTELFNRFKDKISFSILPYHSSFINSPNTYKKYESLFYTKYYLRLNYILPRFLFFLRKFIPISSMFLDFILHALRTGKMQVPNFKQTNKNIAGEMLFKPVFGKH